MLESHLLEWVDRANHNRVAINDHVLKVAAEKLMLELNNKEDYTGFNISNGWIQNLKQRHSLRNKKKRGDGGEVDEKLLPGMRQELKEVLDNYSLQDIFNCDELALQYVGCFYNKRT